MSQCTLCEIFEDESSSVPYNRIVFETHNFAIVPSIGPIEIGHFLIVAKKHTCGSASMHLDEISELFLLMDMLSSKFPNGEILFFEHGGIDPYNQAGACINHTHIHVLPGHAESYNIFDDSLVLSMSSFNKDIFSRIDCPYIMTFNGKKQFRVYDAHNVHSQMMRRAICSKQGYDNWNWRNMDQQFGIEQGIEFWNEALKGNL